MAVIDDTTQELAEALGLASRRVGQGLRPYTDGTASPGGLRYGPYTPDQVDEYVEDFLTAAVGVGYTTTLPPGTAAVESGDTVLVQGHAGAAVVAGGVLTSVTLPATSTVVSNGTATLNVVDAAAGTSTGTAAVAAGALSSITLVGTNAIVSDSQVLPEAGGGTITLAITDGVITATYTAG